MNFGIMEMQLISLVPPGDATPEQAIAHIARQDHVSLVEGLCNHGFNLIEIGGDLTLFLPQSFEEPAIDRLCDFKRSFRSQRSSKPQRSDELQFTVHLPLWSVEPSTLLSPVREGSVQAMVEVIEAVKPLEPLCYVLHATGALAAEFYRMRLPESAKGLILRQFQARAASSLREILSKTGIPSRSLAVETIEFPFDLTLELAEEVDCSICLDTGHVLAGFSGELDLFDVLERILPRLAEVHLHDCPQSSSQQDLGYGKDHQALGKGDLDTKRFLKRLMEVDYQNPIIFELSLAESLNSLDEIRAVFPEALAA